MIDLSDEVYNSVKTMIIEIGPTECLKVMIKGGVSVHEALQRMTAVVLWESGAYYST